MSVRRRLAACAGLCVTALIVTACGNGGKGVTVQGAKLVQKGHLTTCTHLPYPPFQSGQGGKVVGFDVDMIDLVAKKLGVTQKVIDTPFETIKTGATLAAPVKKTYQDDLIAPAEEGVRDAIVARASQRARLMIQHDRAWDDIPLELVDLMVERVEYAARVDVSGAISTGRLPSAVHHRLLDAAILTYLRAIDTNLLIVQWQESTPADEIARDANALGLKALRAKLPDLIKAVQATGRKPGR